MKRDLKPAQPAWLRLRGPVVSLVALMAVMPSAWSLSLGRLNVQSALGEPLRAEIDVTSITQDETSSFNARVAAPESYKAAGVDYNAVLGDAKVSLQRRADGRPYLKITSDRAVQEPFVDVILEMNWSNGKLVREYTLLFDPPGSTRNAAASAPEVTGPSISAAPAPVGARASATAPVAEAAPAPAPAPVAAASAPAAAAATATRRPPAAKPAPAPAPATAAAASGATYRVRNGDTLSGIAEKVQSSGASLDQMVVGLYRANPDAFMGRNMNRLRAGAVLDVPSVDAQREVTTADARAMIRAQSRDFNAYRRTLAGAAIQVPEASTAQSATGKVEAKVDDKRQPDGGAADKLTLSKGGVGAKGAPSVEQKIAEERAREDSDTRVAELSRNLQELNKLKDQTAAAASSASGVGVKVPVAPPVIAAPASTPSPVAEAPKASTPSIAAVPPKSTVAEPKASTPSVESIPPKATAAASTTPAPAPTQAAEAASAAASVAEAASAVATEPTPEEPGFFARLAEGSLLLPLAGVGVALLALLGLWRMRSARQAEGGETSFLESRLQPDSFFGASGGQHVDTHDASGMPSSMSYSLSQLDAIGDVDPVAEADVYLAYGRDLQAEEILKEAMRSNPDRMAIRTKLLEVYAKRRDTKGYELLASQLHALTGAEGEDWEKAQEMGRSIDPENPLYMPGGRPEMPEEANTSVAAVGVLGATTMPQSVLPEEIRAHGGEEAFMSSMSGLDLDLELTAGASQPAETRAPVGADLGDLELPDLHSGPSSLGGVPDLASTRQGLSAFDEPVDIESRELPAEVPPAVSAHVDFEPSKPGSTTTSSPSAFDFSGFTLDLDSPSAPGSFDATPSTTKPTGMGAAVAGAVAAGASMLGGSAAAAQDAVAPAPDLDAVSRFDFADSVMDVEGDPLTRKMELAEEFLQIGDVEGARELLREVADQASGALQSKAQAMLDDFA